MVLIGLYNFKSYAMLKVFISRHAFNFGLLSGHILEMEIGDFGQLLQPVCGLASKNLTTLAHSSCPLSSRLVLFPFNFPLQSFSPLLDPSISFKLLGSRNRYGLLPVLQLNVSSLLYLLSWSGSTKLRK